MGLLKELLEWADSLGCQGDLWCRGDWHQPLRLLSKILTPQLAARWQTNGHDLADVTFKISFDSMLQMADEYLGVPNLVTERDLMLTHPNLYVAVLTYLACLHSTLDNLDHKMIRQTTPPKLVFEARNGSDAIFPTCPGCDLHVFFVERVLIDGSVWHRQCLRCARCGTQLRRGSWRRAKDGSLECVQHLPRATLDAILIALHSQPRKAIRPAIAPPPTPPKPKPVPPPKPAHLKRLSEESNYETLDAPETTPSTGQNGNFKSEDKDGHSADSVISKSSTVSDSVEDLEKRLPTIAVDASSGDSGCDVKETEPSPVSPTIVHFRQKHEPEEGSGAPVRPPRPKRESQLIQSTVGPIAQVKPTPTPRSPVPVPRRTVQPLTIDIVDYPGFLNPFGDDEEVEDESLAEDALNPFADDMDDDPKSLSTSIPRPAPTPSPRSAATLPGTSDRPRSQPPPPPPKPPRTPDQTPSPNSKFRTLPRTKKSYRAPLPPVPQRRKIMFTEHDPNATTESAIEKVVKIEEEMIKIEISGSSMEKELLINISQNPNEWMKGKKVNEFLAAIQSKVELIRQQNSAMYIWLEAHLNEIHSEIEYQLRCLIEKDVEKTNEEIEAEAKLLELLVEILTEKSELVQSQLEPGSPEQAPSEETTKKKKLFIRMKKLKKKLKSTKK